ncbi:probable disease resistance protein At5g66900 [Macadamia integrifolia]|uniref:probable disease resistance protein At5g66900 n=1 Tax=Macadamia integrifolia TaxID=60698 RepID=UPI001C52B4CD|nr:probable disease resistance protein At5g66900 [Macadamia integrifolia]
MTEEIKLDDIAGELLRVILEMKDKAVNFRENIERLQNTLEQVVPLFEEGSILDFDINDPKREELKKLIVKLQRGKTLVQKCCKVPSWNIYTKIRYSSKIIDLDETILRFCQRELQSAISREEKQLSESTAEGSVGSVRKEGFFAVPKLPHHVVGFDRPLADLKVELFEENVTVLGICAPGGCGKSTLAAMLCQDQQVRGKFEDKIFFVNVSKNPTTLKILRRLLREIGGGVPGTNLSQEDATKIFHYLLKQRKSEPLLLVLDDVWDDSIIEMFFSRTEGYKMLVTSRDVFSTYDSKYHSKYLLKTLSHQDSMTLFRQTTSSQGGNEPDEDLLNEIVRYCDGFPLAIIVIGKSLSQKPVVKWKIMATELLKGSSILDFDEKLRKLLATSLDSLDDTVLDCFLDLGSFPKDKWICASALIDIWCELYELDYEDDAYANLLNLASHNLVNLVGSRKIAKQNDASFNEVFVTQHDLLKDLAIYKNRQERTRVIMDTGEKGLPKSRREQENHYLNARLVSLCTDEMCSSWYDLQFPKVEGLIMNFSASNYALPPFVETMRKLKVLIIVNSGWTHAKLSNLKTLGELANLKRIRLEKISIPSLHEFTMPWMNLQKISLVMCAFGQDLMKCTIDVSYLLPNLVEIDISYCHDLVELPPWICDVIYLRTLRITYCDNLSALTERIGFMANLEELRLHACTGLPKLPDSIKGLQKLRFLDISDCCDLKILPDGMGELHCLKKLDMRGCIELRELPPATVNLVGLKEVICDENKASLWEPLSSRLKITFPVPLKEDMNLDWLGTDI